MSEQPPQAPAPYDPSAVPRPNDPLADLWNGDTKVTAEQAQWIRQALDAQHPVAQAPARGDVAGDDVACTFCARRVVLLCHEGRHHSVATVNARGEPDFAAAQPESRAPHIVLGKIINGMSDVTLARISCGAVCNHQRLEHEAVVWSLLVVCLDSAQPPARPTEPSDFDALRASLIRAMELFDSPHFISMNGAPNDSVEFRERRSLWEEWIDAAREVLERISSVELAAEETFGAPPPPPETP